MFVIVHHKTMKAAQDFVLEALGAVGGQGFGKAIMGNDGVPRTVFWLNSNAPEVYDNVKALAEAKKGSKMTERY